MNNTFDEININTNDVNDTNDTNDVVLIDFIQQQQHNINNVCEIKNIKIFDKIIYNNLVFSGGGVLGLGYVGVIKALNDLDKLKHITHVIGTSVGSIFALFVACKLSNDKIDLYVNKYFDNITKLDDKLIKKIDNLSHNYGLYSNDIIRTCINNILNDEYNDKYLTFKQLYEKTKIDFTVVSTCLTDQSIVYFNHITTPHIIIADAITASSSIPLFFTCEKIDNKIYVDGCMVSNFPIDYYDDKHTGFYNKKTLGFNFIGENKKTTHEINGYVDYLKALENVQFENNINQSIENINKRNIISINTGNISSIDFNINENNKQFLITNGYESVINYYKNIINNESIFEILFKSVYNLFS